MKTIEERAIEERAREYILNANNTIELPARRYGCYVGQLRSAYIAGAAEQKASDKEAALKGFTTDELRAELKIRNAEERAKKESILRCRMCKHWGEIDYWGNPTNYTVGKNCSCVFFKTKNGKNYRCHNDSQLACEHFERKKE